MSLAARRRVPDDAGDPGFSGASERAGAAAFSGASERAGASAFSGASEVADVPGGARRTVVITGRGSERYVPPRRAASARGGYDSRVRVHERAGFKPDRVAMWAVLLGLALLLGAATSSHAAVLHAVLQHIATR